MSAPSTPTRSVSEKVGLARRLALQSLRCLCARFEWAWEGPFLSPAMLPHALEDSTLVHERPPFSVRAFSGSFPP